MKLHQPDSPLARLLSERNTRARLLIVDDHPMSLMLAELTFADHFELITANNGPMALALCQQQAPDLVLLDIDMPDMDGFEVCRQLKSNEATRDIAVIFLTAQADEAQEARGLGLFAVDFIAKPLHPAVALARVNTHLLVKLQADAIRKLVFLDGLSGIYNRRFFDQQLVVEIARSVRNGSPLALILLDVDFFKHFNDHYGHQAGDDCLREIATALKASLRRPADLVARYGGEEFACILPETDFSGAMAIARVLEDRIRKKFIPHARSSIDSVVSISLGVAVRSGFSLNHASELLATADEQLYHAKHTGRGRACGILMGAPAAS
jgi:diguanylate cyclase (GGDEF)-like protein